jgi:hypothetical protein
MATDTSTSVTQTDIFKQQAQTIELLQDAIAKQQSQGPSTVYMQPTTSPTTTSPNYLVYVAIGIAVLLLFRGKFKL